MRQPIASCAWAAILIGFALTACGKMRDAKPAETAQSHAEAKLHKDACGSNSAYDHIKRVIFDEARAQQGSYPTNLDTLESFSFVRMDEPVVEGWDPALDITRCNGRFILDVPPGSEQGLGGEGHLTANIAYTAQGAADASGLVYVVRGAEPIVSRLATFHLPDATYRPLPALDPETATTEVARADNRPLAAARPIAQPEKDGSGIMPDETRRERSVSPALQPPAIPSATAARETRGTGEAGAETVRNFYDALGTGNGEVASAQVIPAKRSSHAYSADAISRFYGRLAEPLRLTSVRALPDGAYHVTYRYSGAGVRCNGSATVRLTSGSDRPLIQSIAAENGC